VLKVCTFREYLSLVYIRKHTKPLTMQLTIIQQKIHTFRGERVILAFDISELYQVETKVLNQAVKRNLSRFPEDFMFQLTETEWNNLRSQIVTSSWGGRRRLPYAFTEHGVTMLASVLKSEKAVQMNIAVVRAFIALREAAQQYKELNKKLAEIEQTTQKHFKDIYQALNYLLNKKQKEEDFSKRERIGFKK